MKFDIEMRLGGDNYTLVARDIDLSDLDADLDKALDVHKRIKEALTKRKLI